jgi:hypothetical protein
VACLLIFVLFPYADTSSLSPSSTTPARCGSLGSTTSAKHSSVSPPTSSRSERFVSLLLLLVASFALLSPVVFGSRLGCRPRRGYLFFFFANAAYAFLDCNRRPTRAPSGTSSSKPSDRPLTSTLAGRWTPSEYVAPSLSPLPPSPHYLFPPPHTSLTTCPCAFIRSAADISSIRTCLQDQVRARFSIKRAAQLDYKSETRSLLEKINAFGI